MVDLSIAFSGDKPLNDYIALAKTVDEYGFNAFSIYDDLMFKPAWPILSLAATHTQRVRIGPAISNPYLMHPATIAGNLALLDELSDGRAFLGIGRGAFLDFLRMDQPRPITAVREAIEVIKRLLRGDRTPYHGQIFHATESAFLRWSPPRADVPIMVGTWGPKMCEMSGELADEVKVSPVWNVGYLSFLWKHLEKGARRAGRDPKDVVFVVGVLTSISDDREEAKAYARRALAIYLPYLSPMTEIVGVEGEEMQRVRTASVRGDYGAAALALSDTSLDNFTLYGTPKDIIAKIERMAGEAPVSRIEFGTPHGPDEAKAVRMLGEHVLPHFVSRSV
jgi:5,10-methylenetetrahydromethanopterin reductase|tara:strand:- start:1538 stop:2545 length:1008 start_codon:yes stop_codon:yes gene_type:complete